MKILSATAWSRAFLITDQFGKEHFTPNLFTELVLVDLTADASQIKEAIRKSLDGKISDFEVALNLASGSGKEHMALLEAVMELGLNFRIVTVDQHGSVGTMGMES